jgi:hypothetical protein
MILRFSL